MYTEESPKTQEREAALVGTRNVALDRLRVIAVLAVVMIHTSALFVTSYNARSVEFFWGNIFNSLSRFGVPVFVMISGALMLDENRSVTFERLIRKNIIPIVILLCVWSALYACIYHIAIPVLDHSPVDLGEALTAFLNGHEHMWYLYMLIGLYLATPFLRMIVNKKNKRYVLWFIAISLCVQFTKPILESLSQRNAGFQGAALFLDKLGLDFFCGHTAYYLLGWYMVHVGFPQKWQRAGICLAGIASVGLTAAYACATQDYDNAYSSMNLFVFLYSAGLFQLVNGAAGRAPGKRAAGTAALSKLTFGVYIVHPFVLSVLLRFLPYKSAPFLYIVGSFFAVVVLSFAASFVMSKIPGVKKLVRM